MIGDRGTEALNRIDQRIKALEEERDRWKGMAEKLAEALKDLLNHGTPMPRPVDGQPEPYQAHPEWAEAALSAYESALKEGL